jgi:two-component system phosphate regulon sensor histidine kinase PhoR
MKKRPINKIVIIIILALFVPIFTYTIYQIVQFDENENLIESIYDRQLETIILSINQYCYDIFASWHSELTQAATVDFKNLTEPDIGPTIIKTSELYLPVAAAMFRYSSDYYRVEFSERYQAMNPSLRELMRKVDDLIIQKNDALSRQIHYFKGGYVQPIAIDWSTANFEYTILLFPIIHDDFPGDGAIIGGLLIDDMSFISHFVDRRFRSISDVDLEFAIQKHGDSNLFYYSTEEKPQGPFEQSKVLWILDNMDFKIKMSGTTLDSVAKERARNNMLLLIIVNVVFVIGMLYVIRSVSKEMELAKIKSNLVANVSHEIRTPVALIRMYAETLEMGRIKDEEKKNRYYKTILAETVRLSQLINNMLDFSKIESKKKEYRMSKNDLGVILQQVLDMYHYNFEQKGFHIEKHITPNLPYANIDPEAIIQATVNLLDNAMKYSQENKRIGVSLEQQGQQLVLSVQDHGIGIPESEHKKIFQKFYRVGDSLVHNTKGSGLGLSLVSHIMHVHKGKVTIKSKPGQGSTFSLVFPILHQSGA